MLDTFDVLNIAKILKRIKMKLDKDRVKQIALDKYKNKKDTGADFLATCWIEATKEELNRNGYNIPLEQEPEFFVIESDDE